MSIDTWIGVVGVILSVLFGALSFFFYLRSKSVRAPVFVYDNVAIQTKAHPEVSISFRGTRIDSLSRLRVVFTNKGKKEIRAQDNPPTGFPKIVFPAGARILSINVLAASSPDILFRAIDVSDNTLEIGYSYLNRDDGGVVEVLYDGEVTSEKPIEYKATLIGAEPVLAYRYVQRPGFGDLVVWTGTFSFFVLGSLPILKKFFVALFGGVFMWKGIVGAAMLGFGLAGLWMLVLDPFRKTIPSWGRPHFEPRKSSRKARLMAAQVALASR